MSDKICTNGHVFIGQKCDRCGGSEPLQSESNLENTMETNNEEAKVEGAESEAQAADVAESTEGEKKVEESTEESAEATAEAAPAEESTEAAKTEGENAEAEAEAAPAE